MLRHRTVIATLRGATATKNITRGCPQGGVLSQLLWNLVVDELLEGLKANFSSVLSQGFADDISLLQVGNKNNYTTIAGRITDSLRYLKNWCQGKGLNLNLGETDLILFGYRGRKKLESITMDGICIPRREKVRYLGVTLDEKLNWAQHCANRKAKALKALATCRRLVGKTWGLTPKITAWLYTAVVRPVVTYAAVVWVTATDKISRVKELNRIQRLACLCITGANRSTSTSALEILTGLVPLDIHLRGAALKTMVRLQRHGSWCFNKLRCGRDSHVGRCEDWGSKLPQLELPEDIMTIGEELDPKLYSVIIRDREDWKSKDLSDGNNSVLCFTDGSKTIYGTSCGGLIEDRRNRDSTTIMQFSRAMGQYTTVFQAELHAVHRVVEYLLHYNMQDADIVIYSDSKSVLQSLTKGNTNSSLIMECYQDLNKLGSRNKLTLHWIPAHSGFWGNEQADKLARNAWLKDDLGFYVHRAMGCEPYLPVSTCFKKRVIKEWERSCHTKRWLKESVGRHTREIFDRPLYDSKSLCKLSRSSVRMLTHVYTGHGLWNKHLYIQGKAKSPTCSKCGQEDESAFHVVDKCIAYYHQRFLTWEVYVNDYETLIKTATRQELLDFLMSTGRFQ